MAGVQPMQHGGGHGHSLSTSLIVDAAFGYFGLRSQDFRRQGLPTSADDPGLGQQGFTVQNIELAMEAPVDPYLTGRVFLSVPNLETLGVEEAYFLTTALPGSLRIKAGSFRSQMGANNSEHLHEQFFTRRPLMGALFFGANGLRGPGVQVSCGVPYVPWTANVYLEALSVGQPAADGISTFGGGGRSPANLTYSAVIEQSWSLLRGVSAVLGINGAVGRVAECSASVCAGGPRDLLYGADLSLRTGGPNVDGGSLWRTEYFVRDILGDSRREGAFYSEWVIRVATGWHVGGRFDATGLTVGAAVPRRYGLSASATWAPSDLVRLRIYGQELWGPATDPAVIGLLQLEFSIGPHGVQPR